MFDNHKHYSINFFAFIYFSLVSLTLLFDYGGISKFLIPRLAKLAGFHIEHKLNFLPWFIFFFAILVFFVFIYKNKNFRNWFKENIFFPKLSKTDYVVIIVFLILTFIRLPIPDRSFDTAKYHLYLQNFEFNNNISDSFFPSEFQTFTFPLPDRLFFLFRSLLGYRAGTLFNTFILIILYFQLKDAIRLTFRFNQTQKFNDFLVGLGAFGTLTTEFILANIGVYMIDIFPLPFLMQLLILTLKNGDVHKSDIFLGCLLAGLSISMKFYMIIFCAPLLLIIYLQTYKKIPTKFLLLSISFLAIPLLAYLLFNYFQTDNPIFPYFNNLFQSKYFTRGYWQDDRWGPKNFLEIILWPILVYFQPNRTAELSYYSGRLGLGFIASIIYLIKTFDTNNSSGKKLAVYNLITTLFWSLNAGYIRYGLFGEITSGLIIFGVIKWLVESNYKKHLILGGIFLTLITAQIGTASELIITNKVDWSLKSTFYNDPVSFIKNIKLIGRDFHPFGNDPVSNQIKARINKIDVWIVLPNHYNAGYLKLLNNRVPIINLGYTGYLQNQFDYLIGFNDKMRIGHKNIATISTNSPEELSGILTQFGLRIVDTIEISPSFYYTGPILKLYIFDLE